MNRAFYNLSKARSRLMVVSIFIALLIIVSDISSSIVNYSYYNKADGSLFSETALLIPIFSESRLRIILKSERDETPYSHYLNARNIKSTDKKDLILAGGLGRDFIFNEQNFSIHTRGYVGFPIPFHSDVEAKYLEQYLNSHFSSDENFVQQLVNHLESPTAPLNQQFQAKLVNNYFEWIEKNNINLRPPLATNEPTHQP